MINNIIKLFYSEVVKTKMSNMPNEDYELRDGCKKFRKITLKIDSYLFKGLKIILALFILYLSFHVKIYLGIGVLLVEGIYLVYKVSYEKQVKAAIENVKNNIETSADHIVNENGKRGINLLITLLIISVITGFNYFIGISFIIVFIYTARNIYECFKQ
ncbi:MAG: hypothetical protein PUJ51_16660 [Clostridiales bacterium]|uniref:hypothetical protein n=1 Tax=Terrisporobacter sp. TaxID=1965305 RepID=UPI002A416EA0|nr:hypothetical protein [Terrisporobacter sp.]MCI5629185.1 hypothetical protein [Clostridium sp.]MDD5877977.1 hypothetical protein [Clostridiales bacterium]MCI6456250.1 hypothetical protein [Clostridium sp.]MCI7205513.1 hypothetical protein [Clostridium sp.]MDD7756121.1 hypothetical protein [Clostridiales bacterium]